MSQKAGLAVGILIVFHCFVTDVAAQGTKLAGSGRFWRTWDESYNVYSVSISGDGTTAAIGGAGSGAARVYSRSGFVWSREADIPVENGSAGGDLGYSVALSADGGLDAGDSAYLPALVENAAYRCNIGVVNTGDVSAKVLIELYNGAGAKLREFTIRLAAGQWAQKKQPFRSLAGESAMDRGYAKVTVQSGTGVFALASIIDNLTNDPTAVAMQP